MQAARGGSRAPGPRRGPAGRQDGQPGETPVIAELLYADRSSVVRTAEYSRRWRKPGVASEICPAYPMSRRAR